MDPTKCYATQLRIKIIKVYFVAKSVLLTQQQYRKDFGRNNVPDGKTMQHLVAKFWKTLSVADTHKGRHRPSFSIIPENIQNFRERHEESPRKSTCRLSQETVVSRKSFLRILHDDLKLFPYKIQILQRQTDKNKVERETFCKDVIQRIENDPGLLDLNVLINIDHCGLCAASATLAALRNLVTKRITDLLSGIVKWGKKWPIPANLSFYEICQCLNIKISFQVVEIYLPTSSSYFTSYLQPISNKLLKTSSVFYPTKWGKYHP